MRDHKPTSPVIKGFRFTGVAVLVVGLLIGNGSFGNGLAICGVMLLVFTLRGGERIPD